VRLLLNEIYFRVADPDLQNKFFAGAAKQVFDAVSAGHGEPRQVLDGLSKAAHERRLFVWSAHAREQRVLEPTALGGALASEATENPRVDVYLNDATAAKMDYYLDYQASVKSENCQAGRQDLTVDLTMKSKAPKDTGSLPDYVAGSGVGGPRGNIRTTVSVYAPVGGYFESSTSGGEDIPVSSYKHVGRNLVALTVDLAPGQQRKFSFDVVSGPQQREAPMLRVTPGVHGPGVGPVSGSACS
jgi:hypothetical protein